MAEARQGTAAYFEFYNHERPHRALAYRAPRQVFAERWQLASSARGKTLARTDTHRHNEV